MENIDLEKSTIVTTLPSGDLYRVRTDRQVEEAMAKLPRMQPRRIAGALDCPFCYVAFTSTTARDEHIRSSHSVASGQADTRTVQLPDGSVVPLELLKEEYLNSQRRVEALAAQAVAAAAAEE